MNRNDLQNDEKFLASLNDFLLYLESIFQIETAEGQFVFLNSTKIDQDGSDFLNSIGVLCDDFYKGYECYFNDNFLEEFPEAKENFRKINIYKLKDKKLLWEKEFNVDFNEYKVNLVSEVLRECERILHSQDIKMKETKLLFTIEDFEIEIDFENFCDESSFIEEFSEQLKNMAFNFYAGDENKKINFSTAIYDYRGCRAGIYRNGVKRWLTSTKELPYFKVESILNENNNTIVYIYTNLHYSLIESFVDLLKANKIKHHEILNNQDIKIVLKNENGEFKLNWFK